MPTAVIARAAPGPQRQPTGLAQLPPELLSQVTLHLSPAELGRVRATCRAVNAAILDAPRQDLRQPAGFGAPVQLKASLASRLTRQRDAQQNMACGQAILRKTALGDFHAWSPRFFYLHSPSLSQDERVEVTESGARLILNLLHPEGAQLLKAAPGATGTAGATEGRLRDELSMQLSNHPGHRAILNLDRTSPPSVVYFEPGRLTVRVPFAANSHGTHYTGCGPLNQLSADGYAATAHDFSNNEVHLWRRTDDEFTLRHRVRIPTYYKSYGNQANFAVSPTTGDRAYLYDHGVIGLGAIGDKFSHHVLSDEPLLGSGAVAFSPDGLGLYVQNYSEFAGFDETDRSPSTVHLFNVQSRADGSCALTLCAHLPLAQQHVAWHRADSGAWQLRIFEKAYRAGHAQVRHLGLGDTGHRAPTEAPHNTKQELQRSYAQAISERSAIDIFGADAGGNLFHILARKSYSQPHVYRIAADSGEVSRRPFDRALGRRLQQLYKPSAGPLPRGKALWAKDGTAMQIEVLHYFAGATLYHIDFSQGPTPASWRQLIAEAARQICREKTDKLREITRNFRWRQMSPALCFSAIALGLSTGFALYACVQAFGAAAVALTLVCDAVLACAVMAVVLATQACKRVRQTRTTFIETLPPAHIVAQGVQSFV